MKATFQLLRILPAVLKAVWVVLIFGMLLIAHQYFTGHAWTGVAGLSAMGLGYGVGLLDMWLRKDRRREAAGFYAALLVGPIITLMIGAFLALLGAVVLGIEGASRGFSAARALRLLHFVGVAMAFALVCGIPTLAMRSGSES